MKIVRTQWSKDMRNDEFQADLRKLDSKVLTLYAHLTISRIRHDGINLAKLGRFEKEKKIGSIRKEYSRLVFL